ncbi:Holliday junction branch migration protein RuvA [Rothia sp. HC945]|jgi:Holliday junction DNA helicase RuvA|uniref:Holliday junction branch migration protein RuvA n=1 Tax=Rothia sp. HC945 TaxID=3171170 RepID=UPI002650BCC7|nr:Holliday junction branch migration protein RuvA [Kocuria sp.]MDN5654705.1 Holliday junction branch migration protein RuvA [Kocuria sp.]
MISSLTGTVTHVGLHEAVIEVGGVGMLVQATPGTLATLRLGEQARLETSLIVKEDSLTLFGFRDDSEREVFTTMLSVSGIGPRIALAVVSVHTPAEVAQAVAEGNDKAFSKVPGIGPKGARRIVLELAGKLVLPEPENGDASSAGVGGQAGTGPSWRSQVMDALVGLGWQEKDAAGAVDSYVEAEPDAGSMTVPDALRGVLAGLGRASGMGHRSK